MGFMAPPLFRLAPSLENENESCLYITAPIEKIEAEYNLLPILAVNLDIVFCCCFFLVLV